VAAAELLRWDIVAVLLDEEAVPLTTAVGAGSLLQLLKSGAVEQAPVGILALADQRAQQECMKHAKTLQEYFLHLTAGEVMTSEMVPNKFSLAGPGHLILEASSRGGPKVLAVGLRLGDGPGPGAPEDSGRRPVIAFVAVDEGELEASAEAVAEDSSVVVPVNVDGREARLEEPGPGAWIAVCCPESYLRHEGQQVKMAVPMNCIPTPNIMPTVAVSIKVVSPCCRQPLVDVPIHVMGRKLGSTGADGTLLFRLPAGRRYSCTAPGTYDRDVQVDADPALLPKDGDGVIQREIISSGDLHFCLQNNGADKDWVKFSPNLQHIQQMSADGARPFRGLISMQAGSSGSEHPGKPRVRPSRGEERGACGKQIKSLKLKLADGRPFTMDEEDFLQWAEELEGECLLALVHNSMPKRIGDCPSIPQPDAASEMGCSRTSLRSSSQGVAHSAPTSSSDQFRRGPPLLPPGRPRPCSARPASRPPATKHRRLPQGPGHRDFAAGCHSGRGASPYIVPSPLPPRPQVLSAGPQRREGGCCTNPLFWPDYHDGSWKQQ